MSESRTWSVPKRGNSWRPNRSRIESHDCRMLACVGNGQRHSATVFNRCVLEVSYTLLYIFIHSRLFKGLHLFAPVCTYLHWVCTLQGFASVGVKVYFTMHDVRTPDDGGGQ
jgi:hypothetical protein